MTRTISTPEELDALPVGSIIADFGPDRSWNDSAVIACKAAAGDWTIMGGDPDRRWQSSTVFDASLGHVVAVLHDPSTPPTPAPDPAPLTAAIRAVLELHQPIEALNTRYNRLQRVCTGCGTDDGNWQTWPCPTVRAIIERLDVKP